jgi:hypothetical protein
MKPLTKQRVLALFQLDIFSKGNSSNQEQLINYENMHILFLFQFYYFRLFYCIFVPKLCIKSETDVPLCPPRKHGAAHTDPAAAGCR